MGNEDLFALEEMAMYGVKGLSAYLYHAEMLRDYDKSCYS